VHAAAGAAVLPLNVQPVRIGEEESALYIPPPRQVVELSLKVQLVSVGEDEWLAIPPPQPYSPGAELPVNTQLVSAGEENSSLFIPPRHRWLCSR